MSDNSQSQVTQRFFDKYAEDFDAIYGTGNGVVQTIINKFFRKSMKVRFDKVMEYCHPVENCSVLDVGCGPGLYSVMLANRGASRVVGVDFAEEMLAIAKSKAGEFNVADRCEFITSDVMDYSSDQKFTYCVVMGVMDYIAEPVGFLRHLKNLTEKKIMLSFPVDDGLMAMQRRYRYRNRCPLYMYTDKTLDKMLKEAGVGKCTIERIARDFFVTIEP